MLNFILLLSVILFWLGCIWLYFFFDRLLDDVRAINDELNDIRKDLKEIQTQAEKLKLQEQMPGDEFLGI